jgi:hypothetical protein
MAPPSPPAVLPVRWLPVSVTVPWLSIPPPLSWPVVVARPLWQRE